MTFTEVYLAPCRARLTVTIASRMDIIRVRMLGNPRRRAGGRQDEPGSPGGTGLKSRGRMTGMALMRTIVFPRTVYVSGRTKSLKSFRTRVPRSTRRVRAEDFHTRITSKCYGDGGHRTGEEGRRHPPHSRATFPGRG